MKNKKCFCKITYFAIQPQILLYTIVCQTINKYVINCFILKQSS